MDLDLTEDQEAIRDVFADFFTSETGPERARAAEPVGFDAAAWERLMETGAPGMGVDADLGGGGASLADLAVVAEEAGARIAPLPLVDHQVTARLWPAWGAVTTTSCPVRPSPAWLSVRSRTAPPVPFPPEPWPAV